MIDYYRLPRKYKHSSLLPRKSIENPRYRTIKGMDTGYISSKVLSIRDYGDQNFFSYRASLDDVR